MATTTTTETTPENLTRLQTSEVVTVVNQTREEGILNDVLEQLDRERSRRAELDAEIRQLKEERAKLLLEQANRRREDEEDKESQPKISRKEIIKLETERDGYKELIDMLSADNDAIVTAMNQTEATLPLHIVRLLEIMPWDPRAKQHAKATEVVSMSFDHPIFGHEIFSRRWRRSTNGRFTKEGGGTVISVSFRS